MMAEAGSRKSALFSTTTRHIFSSAGRGVCADACSHKHHAGNAKDKNSERTEPTPCDGFRSQTRQMHSVLSGRSALGRRIPAAPSAPGRNRRNWLQNLGRIHYFYCGSAVEEQYRRVNPVLAAQVDTNFLWYGDSRSQAGSRASRPRGPDLHRQTAAYVASATLRTAFAIPWARSLSMLGVGGSRTMAIQ